MNGTAGERHKCQCCVHTNPDGPREYPTPLFAILTGELERLDYPDPTIRAKGAKGDDVDSHRGTWVT